jgi:CelD/BcsL family acetyltransferase involved in cellulose biosynthesis
MIFVTIGVPDLDMTEHWEALARRADANVFLNPAALNAAAATGFAHIHALLAWDTTVAPNRLVGFWALRERRIGGVGPSVLAAPPYNYSFVSSPVIDPDYIDAVMPALFDAIEKDPALPNVIQIKLLDGDSDSYRAITSALALRKGQMLKLSEHKRPFLAAASERKRSGSTGKKLRQDWNRLSSVGTVDIANDRSSAGAREAFEVFLALEARSWKGANRTALLSDENDAAFTRRLIGDLGERRNASVALLRVDGKPIAAQVLLYSGSMAYTWKTAFDADFAKYSPGALLVDKVTDELFDTQAITAIESCSLESGFMAQLWTGRRMTVDMLVDVGSSKSFSFMVAAFGERLHAFLRERLHRLRTINWPSLLKRMPTRTPKRKSVATTRG